VRVAVNEIMAISTINGLFLLKGKCNSWLNTCVDDRDFNGKPAAAVCTLVVCKAIRKKR
jgi:hypothetical protein